MEDIVALRVQLSTGETRYVMTWGRVFDPVDPNELKAAVFAQLHRFQLPGEPLSIAVCDSLQEAARERYFFEAYFRFAQQPIAFGPRYKAWQRQMRTRIANGDGIAFLGNPTRSRTVQSGRRHSSRKQSA